MLHKAFTNISKNLGLKLGPYNINLVNTYFLVNEL